MKNASKVMSIITDEMQNQLDYNTNLDNIGCFVRLNEDFGIAVIGYVEEEDFDDCYDGYFEVSLRHKIGEFYEWGETVDNIVVTSHTAESNNLMSAVGEVIDMYDNIKPEGTNEYEDFHCINIYNTNEPAHKSAKPTSDTNTAEMEENFYQGYQG